MGGGGRVGSGWGGELVEEKNENLNVEKRIWDFVSSNVQIARQWPCCNERD